MYPVGPAQTVVGYIVREGTIQPAGFFFRGGAEETTAFGSLLDS